jgi:hypothetical protein
VTDLRYAPPVASVVDVQASRLAPQSVRRACQLLIASTLLGFAGVTPFELLTSARPWPVLLGALAGVVAVTGVVFWLILKVYRGRNWARWTVLLLLAPSWALGAIEFPSEIVQAPIAAVVGVTTSAIDILACWLLFFGAGASSYFRQSEHTVEGGGES